jgi:hypothetical protein
VTRATRFMPESSDRAHRIAVVEGNQVRWAGMGYRLRDF